jgi:Domain of unknown function (DU1801)
MPENKTKPTGVNVEAFLDKVADEDQRQDAYTLIQLMRDITGEEPKMWGPSIVGFGSHHYIYESGREGDICQLGFSPRKGNLVVYCMGGADDALLKKLGKYKATKGCVYIKKLADVDLGVLRKIFEANLKSLGKKSTPEPKKAKAKRPRKK